LEVDIVTYGVLAMGCKNKNDAKDLIKIIADDGFRYTFSFRDCMYVYSQSVFSVNAEILGTMLAQACCHFNFAYVVYVLNMVKHEEIKPNQIFMDRLKCFNNTIKDLMKKRVSINF